jgi:hypothetical protein
MVPSPPGTQNVTAWRTGVVAAKKKKVKKFSVSKAVKSNARERLGQPKAERVIPEKPRPETRKAKHKETLKDILGGAGE